MCGSRRPKKHPTVTSATSRSQKKATSRSRRDRARCDVGGREADEEREVWREKGRDARPEDAREAARWNMTGISAARRFCADGARPCARNGGRARR